VIDHSRPVADLLGMSEAEILRLIPETEPMAGHNDRPTTEMCVFAIYLKRSQETTNTVKKLSQLIACMTAVSTVFVVLSATGVV
jgi:hypothetical protein